MSTTSARRTVPFPSIRTAVVGKLNERQVLRLIQKRGPFSRAELVRETDMTAPTVSRAVASLIKAGLLEEADAPGTARGRPAPRLRLAATSSQVLGVAIDAGHCELIAAGLDGVPHGEPVHVPTPATYPELITALEAAARTLMARPKVKTLGIGVSLPGVVDYRTGRGVLSPNVPMTDRHAPAADLAARLGVPGALLQESHALCLAERHYGLAKNIDDFAVFDVGTGIGLGVMLGGRVLKGHSGLAGEIGHITVVNVGGRRCGCGNFGCLETVASESALAYHAGRKLRRDVTADEVVELMSTKAVDLTKELKDVGAYLAIGIGAVVNLFNPAVVFVHSPLFDIEPGMLDAIALRVRRHALAPSFADCRIVRAEGTKRQGAVAGIVQQVFDAVAPEVA